MQITDIKQQVKRLDRFSVFVDGKYAFSFSQDEIERLGLKIGQQFSTDELERLKKSAIEDKAYDRALSLIARRPRSIWEMQDYLRRKSYDEEVSQKILNRLSEEGYLNDLEFARAWIRTRRLLKATNQRKLKLELRQKRLDDEVVEQAMSEDQTDDRAVLRELVERKKKRYPDKLKLMQYLSRQGYNYDDIKAVISELY